MSEAASAPLLKRPFPGTPAKVMSTAAYEVPPPIVSKTPDKITAPIQNFPHFMTAVPSFLF
jgi:hypothetical protein